jgi:hypothetical protein
MRVGATVAALLGTIAFAAPAQAQSPLPAQCLTNLVPCKVMSTRTAVLYDSGVTGASRCRTVQVARIGTAYAGMDVTVWAPVIEWCVDPATRLITRALYDIRQWSDHGWQFDRVLQSSSRYGIGYKKYVVVTEGRFRVCNAAACATHTPQIQFVVAEDGTYRVNVDF